MSRLDQAFINDMQALRLLRDELALHANLLKADLRDRWHKLEADMDVLREHVERAKVAAEDSGKQTEAAIKTLIGSLRSGYSEIKNALKL